jgi:hypothetical protein
VTEFQRETEAIERLRQRGAPITPETYEAELRTLDRLHTTATCAPPNGYTIALAKRHAAEIRTAEQTEAPEPRFERQWKAARLAELMGGRA